MPKQNVGLAGSLSAGTKPKYQYGLPRSEHQRKWNATPKSKEPTLDEGGFGTVAYVLNGEQHSHRVTLTPTDPTGQFYWVRVDSVHSAVSFSVPLLMAREDLPLLIEQWELDDAVWVDGFIASPAYPEKWPIHQGYVYSKKTYIALALNREAKTFTLIHRAGMHTVRTPVAYLAGIAGPGNSFDGLREVYRADISAKLQTDKPLNRETVLALRKASAVFFRESILTPLTQENGLQPDGTFKLTTFGVVPHAEIIGVDPKVCREFEP